jgi:hypothetical protein
MDGATVLKIKDKGLYVSIPGLNPARTPTELDITKCDLSLVLSYLRSNGIKDFTIVSKSQSGEKVLKSRDLVINKKKEKTDTNNLEKRLDRLEDMLSKVLVNKQTDSNDKIKNKLDFLEVLIKNLKNSEQIDIQKPSFKKEPDIEELDGFIPEIDIKGMSMKGDFKEDVIEQNNEKLNDSAELLSKLLNGGGKKWQKK